LPLVAAFSDLVSARITCRRARARFDLLLDCVLQVSEHGGDELKREAADDHNESEEAGDHCQSVFHFFILCRWLRLTKILWNLGGDTRTGSVLASIGCPESKGRNPSIYAGFRDFRHAGRVAFFFIGRRP
jgi:hypothetical protein